MQAAEEIVTPENIQSGDDSEVVLKLAIDRASLLKSLGHLHSVVERRGTVPILANIKIDAAGDKIEMTATDMDIAVVETVNANIITNGSATLPAHTLYEIVRKLPDGAEVEISASAGGKASLSAGHSRFSLSTLPVEDFPAIAEGELAHSFVLSAAECRVLIEKTRFAMSVEDTRYYLNGVYLHTVDTEEDPVLRAVATDGHRLARQEVSLPAGASGMPGAIIPKKSIAELLKLIEEGIEEVKISLSENKIRFVCGSAILVSKLIDGTFPDYTRVIPKGNDRILEINASSFAKAVDRVSVISSDKARGVRMILDNGKLSLSASSAEQGSAEETLEVHYDAEAVDIGFNARYLMDVLTNIEGDVASFAFADATAPATISDSSTPGSLYVIMPMRV